MNELSAEYTPIYVPDYKPTCIRCGKPGDVSMGVFAAKEHWIRLCEKHADELVLWLRLLGMDYKKTP